MVSELTAAEMEAYVRERWECVKEDTIDRDSYGVDSYIVIVNNVHEFSELKTSEWVGGVCRVVDYRLKAWKAAYAATKQREEEIRQARAAVDLIDMDIAACQDNGWTNDEPTYMRILAHEQAHLDSLLVGWKGGKR